MKVSFLSLDQDKNKVYFISDATKKNNTYVFLDNSTKNVTITMTLEDNKVIIQRDGAIQMTMEFVKDFQTCGRYKDSLGLAFEFKIACNKLTISDKKVIIWYDMILEDGYTTSFKLSIRITE